MRRSPRVYTDDRGRACVTCLLRIEARLPAPARTSAVKRLNQKHRFSASATAGGFPPFIFSDLKYLHAPDLLQLSDPSPHAFAGWYHRPKPVPP